MPKCKDSHAQNPKTDGLGSNGPIHPERSASRKGVEFRRTDEEGASMAGMPDSEHCPNGRRDVAQRPHPQSLLLHRGLSRLPLQIEGAPAGHCNGLMGTLRNAHRSSESGTHCLRGH